MINTFRAACGIVAACAAGAAIAQTTDVPAQAAAASTPVAAAPAPTLVVQQPPAVTNGSMLQSNTDVWLSLDKELTSKGAKVGDTIALKVSRDVMLGN